ncbi:MAG TPA: hypothetical protein VH500_17185 [Nitrososphaeraceae archaeon]
MVSTSNIVVPSICVLIVAGIISFFIVYGFYPEKHANVNLYGVCYELVGPAYKKYTNLAAQKELTMIRLQSYAIKSPDLSIPIVFTGSKKQITNFANKYTSGLYIVSNEEMDPGFVNIDMQIVKAIVTKPILQRITNDLTIDDFNPLKKTVGGSIGLQSASYISSAQEEKIMTYVDQLVQNGVKKIIFDGEKQGEVGGVKPHECRN